MKRVGGRRWCTGRSRLPAACSEMRVEGSGERCAACHACCQASGLPSMPRTCANSTACCRAAAQSVICAGQEGGGGRQRRASFAEL